MHLMDLFCIYCGIESETRFELELGDHKILLSSDGIEDLFENTCDRIKHGIGELVARVSK